MMPATFIATGRIMCWNGRIVRGMGANTCEEGPVMEMEVEGQTEGMMQVEAEGGGYSEPMASCPKPRP